MDNILRDLHWNTNTPKQIQLCLHSTNMLVSCVRGWDACIACPGLFGHREGVYVVTRHAFE